MENEAQTRTMQYEDLQEMQEIGLARSVKVSALDSIRTQAIENMAMSRKVLGKVNKFIDCLVAEEDPAEGREELGEPLHGLAGISGCLGETQKVLYAIDARLIRMEELISL